jgi:DNA-directed RNA polymerase specialized sigma24 family protein
MFPALSSADVAWLGREADFLALRLVRRFGLPHHQHEDLRQDLLVDLIARLEAFDPTRGTLRTFAGTVIAHHAGRLANRIRRERTAFTPVSLDDPLPDSDGLTLGDTIAESGGYLALHGQPTDRLAVAERRLDLERALPCLASAGLRLCAQLLHRSPTALSRHGGGPRASLYRRLRDLRLQLLAAGIATAA